MEPDEDRSELFNEIQKFSQRKLKKVETKVKTGLGDDVTEKRTAKGLSTTDASADNQNKNVPINQNANKKLDLQVGMVTGGLMIGSNDVATSNKTLNEYGSYLNFNNFANDNLVLSLSVIIYCLQASLIYLI